MSDIPTDVIRIVAPELLEPIVVLPAPVPASESPRRSLDADVAARKVRWAEAAAAYRAAKAECLSGLSCTYCGMAAETFDHVVPRTNGGGDLPDNLVAVCGPCNRSKSALDVHEWIKLQYERASRAGDGVPWSHGLMRRTAYLDAVQAELVDGLRLLLELLEEIDRESQA